MLCKVCGKEISDSAAFCQHCGAKVEQPPENVEAPAENPAEAPASAEGKSNTGKVLAIFVVSIIAVVTFIAVIIGATTSKNNYSSSSKTSSYSYSSRSSTGMTHSEYCKKYIKVSNVEVKRKSYSSDYVYVTGSVKNTGTYSVKYVKVRAACKDYSGNTIDTDWTYAVDSEWLEPGESKTFEMMVRDESHKIKTATVTVITD